jgi:hypothetical protein
MELGALFVGAETNSMELHTQRDILAVDLDYWGSLKGGWGEDGSKGGR